MAYQIKGGVIINDSRELIGVNTAGINTALYVGGNITLDASTGEISATSFNSTGVISIDDVEATGYILAGAGVTITSGGLVVNGGNSSFAGDVDITGALSFDGGNKIYSVETTVSAASTDGELPTAKGVYDYVDTLVGGSNDLSIAGDTGSGTVNLVNNEVLTFEGGTNVETVFAEAGVGNTVTINLSDDISVVSVTASGDINANGNIVGDTATNISGINSVTAQTYYGDGSNLTGIIGEAGDAVISGHLEIESLTVTPGIATFAGLVDANGGLDVADHSQLNTLNVSGLSTFAADVDINAGLNVQNQGVFQAGVNVASLSELNELIVSGLSTFSADVDINAGLNVQNQGVFQAGLDVTGHSELDSLNVSGLSTFVGNTELGGLVFTGGTAAPVTGIITSAGTITAASLDTDVASAKAIYNYVDGQVGAANQLRFTDGTTNGEVELATEVLTFSGTTNEIEVAVTNEGAGIGNTVTFGLPNSVEITSTLAANNVNGSTVHVGTDAIGGESNLNLLKLAIGGPGSTYAMFNNGSSLDGFRFVDDVTDVFVLDHSGATNVATLTGRLDVSAGAQITGVCTATDFNSTSDIRKKENIVEIDNAVEKVQALRGVTFDWKDGSGSSGGIIAQEVEAVLPTLVKEGEDHKTVIYNGLIGLLINAVKEQQAQIDALSAKLG